jgi:hypothetical protein
MAGISTIGVGGFTQSVSAQESNANVSVRFTDQESSGESIVIDSLKTNVEAELLIFESESDLSIYNRMHLDAGTEFSNRRIELASPIPETQLISILVRPPEGDSSYGLARATVTVGTGSESAFGTNSNAQRIDANPEAGFHSPYFLWTPDTPDLATESVNNSRERPLLVEVQPWGNFGERVNSARERISGGTNVARDMKSPTLIAPLTIDVEDPFLRQSDPDPRQERVDLQLLAMIEDAKSRLESWPYTVTDQIHGGGGSLAGIFWNAFAALHPEHIRVMSSGANGIAFLPFEELTDDIPTFGNPRQTTVPWPIGAGEIDELADKEFNRRAWMEIEQYRWIGAEDQDPENPDRYVHKIYKGPGEIVQLVEEIFGSLQVDHRFETSRKIYDHLGVPATFDAYEGAGHVPEGEQANQGREFHKRKIAEHFELIHLIPQPPASKPRVGDTVTVPVTAENHTDVASTTTATLAADGTEVDTTTIEVGPNSTKTFELATTFEETGEFTLSVNGTALGEPVVVSEEIWKEPEFGITLSVAALGGLGLLLKRKISDSD